LDHGEAQKTSFNFYVLAGMLLLCSQYDCFPGLLSLRLLATTLHKKWSSENECDSIQRNQRLETNEARLSSFSFGNVRWRYAEQCGELLRRIRDTLIELPALNGRVAFSIPVRHACSFVGQRPPWCRRRRHHHQRVERIVCVKIYT
jgi:hypothetical protein